MFIKNKKGYYEFKELSELGLLHGFSTVLLGDMQFGSDGDLYKLKKFISEIDQAYKGLVVMNQMHGNNIESVSLKDNNTIKKNTDGLITQERGLFLTVKTADCLPLILFDKQNKIIAVVHAGYKGVYANIVQEAIHKLVNLGSETFNIVVGIGPSIRDCCYVVNTQRAQMFKQKFPESIGYLIYRNGEPFLSLQCLVKWQLRAAGVMRENIFDAMMCTQDNPDEFFSFRARMGKATGEVGATVVSI